MVGTHPLVITDWASKKSSLDSSASDVPALRNMVEAFPDPEVKLIQEPKSKVEAGTLETASSAEVSPVCIAIPLAGDTEDSVGVAAFEDEGSAASDAAPF